MQRRPSSSDPVRTAPIAAEFTQKSARFRRLRIEVALQLSPIMPTPPAAADRGAGSRSDCRIVSPAADAAS